MPPLNRKGDDRMYADFEYYSANYAGEQFDSCGKARKYLRAASMEIDRITFGRFRGTLPQSKIDAEKLQDCTCEVAEALLRIDTAKNSDSGSATMVNGVQVSGVVSSISSGSESISFKTANNIYTNAAQSESDRDALIYAIIRRYLTGVSVDGINVLFCGVM